MYRFLLLLASAAAALGQSADPAYPFLEKAYAAMSAHQYPEAVAAFEQAIAVASAASGEVHGVAGHAGGLAGERKDAGGGAAGYVAPVRQLAVKSTTVSPGATPTRGAPVSGRVAGAVSERPTGGASVSASASTKGLPVQTSVRKDFAYALPKIGENERARDQFAEAARLDPSDTQAALEYAFLCYETKKPIEARRTFHRLRLDGNMTAAQAFENIDRPLREGIERWKQAVALSANNFSAHEELARLAEQRDETALAAEHYEKAWRLRPERRELLLALGRVWQELKREDEAGAALIAASRGAEPRTAEQARELLPARYPYVYEFEKALALDPGNVALRSEFAFLYLAMERPADAENHFEGVVRRAPDDLLAVAQLGLLRLARGDTAGAMPLLERILKSGDQELADRVRTALSVRQKLEGRTEAPRARVSNEAKELADKSLEKGYMQDALQYLTVAHETDPVDFDVMLKLGRTYNILKSDREAVKWFGLARRSPDAKTAAEAARAYKSLAPTFQRFRTTVWAYPMFSTRWHDLFLYTQAKTEMKLPGDSVSRWLHPYASVRFIGDAKSAARLGPGIAPQYLSEQSVIAGVGLATSAWKGARGWFEAGEAFRLRPAPVSHGLALPDYRGGVAFSRTYGEAGWYVETSDDLIYVHRFGRDTLAYSQNRLGYKTARTQFYWNVNATVDSKRESWANFAETGPGMRFRLGTLPALFSVDLLQGVYLIREGNPRGPKFNDLRVGVWYAFTR